jgi:methylated-DNA-[protein]-cysteine S-methyltransferase
MQSIAKSDRYLLVSSHCYNACTKTTDLRHAFGDCGGGGAGTAQFVNTLLESWQARIEAPFAVIGVRTIGERLVRIEYLPRGAAPLKPQTPFSREVCRQLKAYLKEPNFDFDLPFDYAGTDFQTRVWEAVRSIPVGAVLSYQQVGRRIGSAPRPVGTACGANKIPILIPCHRVVGSQGIGGFMNARRGAAIDVKRWLLHHENPGAY